VNSQQGRWQQSASRGKPATRLRARLCWHDYLCDTAMSNAIVRLDGNVEVEVSEPAADRLLAGAPRLEVRNFFADASQQFFAGRWSATRGKWRVRYTESELCVMTAGRVVLESATGERCAFGPGDAFVVPAGFVGTWEVIEDCSKIYAIFESRG
jgi:uncharacterized cupin superfamily protein